jgi:hypothetical protein
VLERVRRAGVTRASRDGGQIKGVEERRVVEYDVFDASSGGDCDV